MVLETGMPITNEIFAQLLVCEHDKLEAYVWQIVKDDHLARDVLQEMALVATRKLDQIADREHFAAWARVTCRNISFELLRFHGGGLASDAQREAHGELGLVALHRLVEDDWRQLDQTDSYELTAALRRCLARLGPAARQMIDLRYGQGMRSSEVAERLGRKVTTVYMTLSRIHRSLGDCVRQTLAGRGVSDV